MKILFQILALIIVYIKSRVQHFLMRAKGNSSSQLSTNTQILQPSQHKKLAIKGTSQSISGAGKFGNLYQKRNSIIRNTSTITYHLKSFWKQQAKERELIEGNIAFNPNLSEEEAKILIFEDIQKKGKILKKGAKLFVKFRMNDEIYNKQQDLYEKQDQEDLPAYVQAMLIQNKINLPQGYKYLPNKFEGFIVKNLSISNQFGTVTWNLPVDIQNIDFSEGISLKINSLQCSIPDLQKDVLIEFYYLCKSAYKYLQKHGKQKLKKKIKRSVEETQGGNCRLVFINELNWHWFVNIVLSKK